MDREKPTPERRRNHELREVLDDLIDHIREFVRMRDELSPSEIEYAQQKLEWLADEAWRLASDATSSS
jgi:rubrerythrin